MERGRKGNSFKKILRRQPEADGEEREDKRREGKKERKERRNRWKDRERKNKNNFLEYCRFWRKKKKNYIENFDITDLIETWMKEKGWERMKKELS